MVDALNNFFGQISNFLWGNFYMIVLVMTGVMFTTGQILPRFMMNLPDSTRQFTTSVSQLIRDNAE